MTLTLQLSDCLYFVGNLECFYGHLHDKLVRSENTVQFEYFYVRFPLI